MVSKDFAILLRPTQVTIDSHASLYHFPRHGLQTQDARPDTIRQECDRSLERLGTDRIELY